MSVCVCGEASRVSLPHDRWSALPHFAAQSGSGECGTSTLFPHPLALCVFTTVCGAVHTGDAAVNEHTDEETQTNTEQPSQLVSLSLSVCVYEEEEEEEENAEGVVSLLRHSFTPSDCLAAAAAS